MSKICPGNNKKIIISFSGRGNGMGTLPQFEFVNFLEKHFSNYERHFYLDKQLKWYHKGIDGISKSISETALYLKNIISKFEEVIFIGSSAGGYAAILFGSLLKVDKIIAFKPQTIIKPECYTNNEYINLKSHINSVTKYFIYGDLTVDKIKDNLHHISHCKNINIYPNVDLNTKYVVDLKNLRNKGILQKIMESHI